MSDGITGKKSRCLLIVEDDVGLHGLSRWSFDAVAITPRVAS